MFPSKLRFVTALFMIALLSAFDIVPAAAGLAPSSPSGASTIASVRDADLITAQRVLENKVVAQKLRDYGVSPEQARAKLAAMSDQDLHTLATQARGLPSGGDDALGTIIALLLIVLLVIVILKLLNKRVVVK
jgi:hypothetical protein